MPGRKDNFGYGVTIPATSARVGQGADMLITPARLVLAKYGKG